jgi:glutathione synthase
MPPARHLFVIDPLASLNLKLDSSLRLMAALARRGHEIFVCEPRQLSWRRGERAAEANAQALTFGASAEEFQASDPEMLGLGSFQAVHMRKDPPYDLDYLSTTWLLDAAPKTTKVYNDPEGLRRFNEKLAILRFPEEVRPGLVSADPDQLLHFAEREARGDAVLKPLTLFGGRGVIRLRIRDSGPSRAEARKVLVEETAKGTQLRLIQGFDSAIFGGEVRAFTAFGKPIAWCLKKPEDGNFLANTRAGAKLLAHKPTQAEVDRVTKVAVELAKHGIVFIGFDVIGGYISEINVTSPRLLTAPGDETDYYGVMAAAIEADLA